MEKQRPYWEARGTTLVRQSEDADAGKTLVISGTMDNGTREKIAAGLAARLNEEEGRRAARAAHPDKVLHIGRGWECPTSPTGHCVYDYEEDPAFDECLYCGKPEERK